MFVIGIITPKGKRGFVATGESLFTSDSWEAWEIASEEEANKWADQLRFLDNCKIVVMRHQDARSFTLFPLTDSRPR